MLVGCEFSRVVSSAIEEYGHDVTSCDTLPAEQPGKHYTGSVFDIIGDGWSDILVFPPCTYLAASQWFRCKADPERMKLSDVAMDFVADLDSVKAERKMRENPVGRVASKNPADIKRWPFVKKPIQYVQPYEFGHDHSKKTGLQLEGFPKLTKDPADYIEPRMVEYPVGSGRMQKRWSNQSLCGADNSPEMPGRSHKRSRFFTGIAAAIGAQWYNTQGATS